MKVLVFGANGQLARHLREELPDATFWGRAALDLAGNRDVTEAIENFAPSTIVNAAAYTAVDEAETERSAAWSINGKAPAAIAGAATLLEIPLVHVSTDYVFDGRKSSEYSVDDAVRPINVYGATKLAGELAVTTLCKRSWILRTSWVFSEHGANFVRTILRLAATRRSLRVVADQRSRPTYAKDVAVAIAKIVRRSPNEGAIDFGLYHATGGPVVSWFDFAEKIVQRAHALRILKTRTPVSPITTAEYPTAAARPANSALLPSAEITGQTGVPFDWPSSLERMLEGIAKNGTER